MKKFPTILLGGLLMIFSNPTRAQFSQQGNGLVGTGAVGSSQQGHSVSLSSDGNTAISGGWQDNGGAGALWVFTRTGSIWSQQGSKLVGSGAVGAAHQGWSACISADGSTAIVGGWHDNGDAGAAWIFTRAGSVWSQQGSKLVGTGATGAAQQGYSVSLSSDGNTAIVGGYSDNAFAGAAWVFTRAGGVWSQQGNKLIGTGAQGSFAQQGYSVSLSSDGNTAIVGGYGDSSYTGAAWVFTRNGSVWSQQGGKIVGTAAVGGAGQGFSVFISPEGNTAIVGGPDDNNEEGAAWVFTRSAGVWTQQGNKLVGTGAVGSPVYQGESVSLSSDGNTAIVGGESDNGGVGAAWVFTRSAGLWTQLGSKLVGSGTVTGFGQYATSLSSDGNTAMVGGYPSGGEGAAWIYTRVPSGVRAMGNDTPWQFRLEQNYPNPFNPSTTIEFSLPKSRNVVLKMFNALGEDVTTIVSEELHPGSYKVEWNPLGVASGVYFYRIQAGDFVETKRLILLR